MSILDDTAIFTAIIQQGGLSHAAKKLRLSNGLVSRRLAKLEAELGVSLLKRTTRQLQLTPEGELFWQHAKRIQQELDSAICLIQGLSDKPKGDIRISAPVSFGKHYLMPILNQFMHNFKDIHIDLILSDQFLDPIKENVDLLIRGMGYFDKPLKDSSMKTKLLVKLKINLYATPEYLIKNGTPLIPEDLHKHLIIGFSPEMLQEPETWVYHYKNKKSSIAIKPTFNCNDFDSRVSACLASHGIGKFTELVEVNYLSPSGQNQFQQVLKDYDWGMLNLYAVYSQQHALPKRTRLLLDFISAHTQNLQEKVGNQSK